MTAMTNYANKQLRKERTKATHPVRNGKAGGTSKAKKVRTQSDGGDGKAGRKSSMGKVGKKATRKVAK